MTPKTDTPAEARAKCEKCPCYRGTHGGGGYVKCDILAGCCGQYTPLAFKKGVCPQGFWKTSKES